VAVKRTAKPLDRTPTRSKHTPLSLVFRPPTARAVAQSRSRYVRIIFKYFTENT